MAEDSVPDLVSLVDIEKAAAGLPTISRFTPVVRFQECYLKLESLQPTGSFKIRGAFTKLSRLPPSARSAGVVAYSSGNHGLAVAHAARMLGVAATIVVPADASPTKVLAIGREGAELVHVASSSDERRAVAESLAEKTGKALIPPYDDRDVISGQGTIGLELLEQLPDMTTVVVPVGGGGLVSGIAAAVKAARPEVRVVGVEPELAGDAHDSFARVRLVRWEAEQVARTVADGVRTQSLGELGFEHITRLVDEMVLVSEEEIYETLVALLEAHLVVEPAGALSLTAVRSGRVRPAGATAVISGANVSIELLGNLVQRLTEAQQAALQPLLTNLDVARR